MDHNNKITSDVTPVSRLPKAKSARGARRASAPRPAVQPGAIPATMTIKDWNNLTTRSGKAPAASARRDEEDKGGEKCGACKSSRISGPNPPAICTLCMIRVCSKCKRNKKLKPLEDHDSDEMPKYALGNAHEQEILKDYMSGRGITLKKVFDSMLDDMVAKKWTYKNGLNADVTLAKTDVLCEDCFANIWSDLLYRYRVSVSSMMPAEVKKRKDCWYGKDCKTQRHNDDHAKKLSHICEKRSDK